MSKTFTQIPKPKLPLIEPPPSAEVIAAFEKRGPGQDTQNHIATNVVEETPVAAVPVQSAKTDKNTEQPAEPTQRLSIDVPKSLHRRFKTACARHDKKMVVEVMNFIEKRTAQLEKEKD